MGFLRSHLVYLPGYPLLHLCSCCVHIHFWPLCILYCIRVSAASVRRQAHSLWLNVQLTVPHCVCFLSVWLPVPYVPSLPPPQLVASALCMYIRQCPSRPLSDWLSGLTVSQCAVCLVVSALCAQRPPP